MFVADKKTQTVDNSNTQISRDINLGRALPLTPARRTHGRVVGNVIPLGFFNLLLRGPAIRHIVLLLPYGGETRCPRR